MEAQGGEINIEDLFEPMGEATQEALVTEQALQVTEQGEVTIPGNILKSCQFHFALVQHS